MKSTGDKLDRYRDHLFSGTKLRKKEREMLEKYRKAYSVLNGGYSQGHAVALIRKEYECSESQAYRIVGDAVLLYGEITELDKKGLRQIMFENFMQLHVLARKEQDFNSANRALENAAKIKKLLDPDSNGIDPKLFLVPVPMLFTTDPAALKAQMQLPGQDSPAIEGAEYVEYEDVE